MVLFMPIPLHLFVDYFDIQRVIPKPSQNKLKQKGIVYEYFHLEKKEKICLSAMTIAPLLTEN